MVKTGLVLFLLFATVHLGYGADLVTQNGWKLVSPAGDATLQAVPGAGLPGGDAAALQVSVARPSDPYWNIEISQVIATTLPVGHRVRLRFWGRSSTRSPVRAVLEQAVAPFTGLLQQLPTLTPQWQRYESVETVSVGYGPNGLGLRFQMGQQAGSVELAGISLEDLGVDPAFTQAQAAIQPAAIRARIRKYRMADLTVLVRDRRGRPVPGARVHVRMTRHAFLFGCNIFLLNPQDSSPLQKAYQAQFAALFNYATLPFYWGTFEERQGDPDYARMDAMAHWCVAHGITPKAHPLVWHQVWPSWAPEDADAAIPLLHQRVTDIVTHYRGLIHYYDVVNEANSADPKTGEGAWIQRDGAAAVVGTALRWARAAGRGADDTFLYNDYNTGSENVALLTQLREKGQLPDAIGIQSHMHGGVWPMTQVWQTCQRFARFGVPLHFTETTVISGPKRIHDPNGPAATDWVTTPQGEAAQADYVARFYTLLFSHPAVRAITWWDFSDLNAWQGAPAGLVRKDMSPKPVYGRLMALIHKKWWTDATGRTGDAGGMTVHAFYGDYQITGTDAHGHAVTQALAWPEASGPRRVILTLP